MARTGVTQAELARDADVDVRTIKQILSGVSARPHPRTLHRLARALDVSADEFFRPAESVDRLAFDRATNPMVDAVLADHPQLCAEWTADDFADLYSHFGAGGALTYEGAREMIARVERKRATLDRAALVLETDLADVLIDFVAMLHRRVAVSDFPATGEAAASATRGLIRTSQ